VVLRGTIDAGAYTQFIFPVWFFKRSCDVYDGQT
jgi:type I restriction enzyme M protein